MSYTEWPKNNKKIALKICWYRPCLYICYTNNDKQMAKIKLQQSITTTGIVITAISGVTQLERFYIRPVDETVTPQIFGVTSNNGRDTVANGLDFKTIEKALAYVKFCVNNTEYN